MCTIINPKNNISSIAYVTVGTGVGVGMVVNHKPVYGHMHPEARHVPVQPLKGDTFGGYSWGEMSPFKGQNTVEGLTSSVALTERYEQMMNATKVDRSVLVTLPDNHPIWDHAANALANLCTTLLLTVSTEQIVLGGRLMNRTGLLEKLKKERWNSSMAIWSCLITKLSLHIVNLEKMRG